MKKVTYALIISSLIIIGTLSGCVEKKGGCSYHENLFQYIGDCEIQFDPDKFSQSKGINNKTFKLFFNIKNIEIHSFYIIVEPVNSEGISECRQPFDSGEGFQYDFSVNKRTDFTMRLNINSNDEYIKGLKFFNDTNSLSGKIIVDGDTTLFEFDKTRSDISTNVKDETSTDLLIRTDVFNITLNSWIQKKCT